MKLALGTVQFGTNYGVMNNSGQVSIHEAALILDRARASGIDTLDTAIAYGNSEQTLGEIGVRGWKVISKLPSLLDVQTESVVSQIERHVTQSLSCLKVEKLDGLLLHRSGDLVGNKGELVFDALTSLKRQGLVGKIGVSIYAPQELDRLSYLLDLDLVQAPFSVIDQNLKKSSWLERLSTSGVEVHSRSTFLQGLLLANASDRPEQFHRWKAVWQKWDAWLKEHAVTPLEASLAVPMNERQIERVVVGVDCTEHLNSILTALRKAKQLHLPDFSSTDERLINPAKWKFL